MKIADLGFIVLVLVTLFSVLRIGYLLVRARHASAKHTARILAMLLGSYMALLVTVSMTSSGDTVAMREPWCFDDWCLAVDSVTVPSTIGDARPEGQWRQVWLTVSSTMRRGRQAEPDAFVFLVDRRGRRIEASAVGERALDQQSPNRHRLTDMLEPSSAIPVTVAFDVLPGDGPFALSKSRRNRFPGMFIVGDAESVLHPPTTVPLR